MRRLLPFAAIILALLPGLSWCAAVTLPMANGLKGLADYRPGKADKPAVLILHGFLQTHHFSTVQLIATELAYNDYPVLTPTLTLGISERETSLTCDAIQAHSVADSTAELAHWVEWLKQQGHHDIILIGHSSGSVRLLAYGNAGADPAVRLLLATSLGALGTGYPADVRAANQKRAHELEKTSPNRIENYSLSYCNNNYSAPPADYLSYVDWDEQHTLAEAARSRLPLEVILGSADRRLPPHWAERLKQAGVKVFLIDGANHFFAGPQEFDFQELVMKRIRQWEDRPR